MKGALARASLLTALILGLRTLTQAALLILLSRLLKPYLYGDYAAAASLGVVLGAMANLGSGYVLMSRATKKATETAHIWRYAWPLTLTMGCVLIPLYGAICTLAIHTPNIPRGALIVVGATELLFTPFTMLSSLALQARELVPLSQIVQWLPSGLRVIAVLLCFTLITQNEATLLLSVATSQFMASFLGAAIGVWIAGRYMALDWKPRLATREEMKLGASYAAMSVVAYNPSELDKIVAVRAVGAYDAGLYTACSRIMNALTMPVVAMILAAQPRLFRHAHAASGESRPLIKLIGLLTFTWGLLSALILVLGARFLPVVLGGAYSEAAALLPWVAMAAPFLSLRIAAGNILVALGRPLERLGYELGGIAILIIGAFSLSPLIGTKGLIVGIVCAEAIMACGGWVMIRSHTKPKRI